ncbi:MAG: sugar ABC transporter substrate-binding protein [Anaerolineae bacterium]|nr:sugar ABC transporter substrate-binding protein [Anaerolineae bacterium]
MIRKLAILALVFALALVIAPRPVTPAKAQDVTITWATIAGFYTDWAEEVARQYEESTGVNVEIIDIDFPSLYENQVLEAVADTGAYDILTYDVGWKAEFSESGYLLPLDDYIANADPAVIAFDDISPALTETTSKWRGKTFGLPYYTFTMGYFYRCDLFENPDEMAAFEAEYGYPLGIPQTYEQLADIAEFFRREPGETLAGKTVEADFYGIGLMAARAPHVQDEINSIAWSWGYKVIEDDGTPGVTSEGFLKAVNLYVNELLPYAPPGATSSAFDQVVAQMRQGLIAQTAAFYLDQYPNMVKTEEEVEGARICTAPAPGAHTWVGAFGLGVSSDSEHPQEAFDFVAWLAGPEAQRAFAAGGGSTSRVSILTDAAFIAEHPLTAGHYPTLQFVLDHTAKSNFYPNYLFVPQGGKIYDEMTTWYSAAASGDESPEGAMEKMAEAIERQCDGLCEIANDALGENYTPVPMPFDYETFLASGAYDIDVWITNQGN